MVPRNRRKPTPKRVQFWWDDFLRAWGSVGRIHQLKAEFADEDDRNT